MAQIPDAVREKLEQPNFWHLCTLNDDGAPTSTPVWAHVEGDKVILNTAIGRRKEKNMRREPRICLSMIDKDNPYAWVEIRGTVAEYIEGDEAERNIDELAKKYMGVDTYPLRQPGERRLKLVVEPSKVLVPNY